MPGSERQARLASALAVVGGLAAACTDRELLFLPELPSDLDFVGVVYRGPEGAWSGSGLTSAELRPLELRVRLRDESYDELHVVGFREETLRSWTDLPAAELALQPLEAPGPQRPRVLSSFSTWAPLGDGALRFTESEVPLEVSAFWAGPCPKIATTTPRPVEHNCRKFACPATLQQVGCELSIQSTTSRCAFELQGTLRGADAFELTGSNQRSPCASEVNGARELKSECPGWVNGDPACTLEVPAVPRAGPRVEVATRRLVAESGTPDLNRFELRGWVLGAEQLTVGRRLASPPSSDPVLLERHELVRLSLPELEVTATSSLPAGLSTFIGGVDDDELLAAFSGDPPWLARLGPEGEILARRDLAPELDWSPMAGPDGPKFMGIRDGLLDRSTERAVLLTERPLNGGELEMRLFVIDARTLETAQVGEVRPRGTGALYNPQPGVVELMVMGRQRIQLRLSAVDQPPTVVDLGAPIPPENGLRITKVLPWPEEELLLMVNTGSREPLISTLFVYDLATNGHLVRPLWESDRAPYTLVRWPPRSDLAVVSFTAWHPTLESGVEGAQLAFFDVRARRFLAGALDVSRGYIATLDVHSDGSLYAMDPLDGVVLRITQTEAP